MPLYVFAVLLKPSFNVFFYLKVVIFMFQLIWLPVPTRWIWLNLFDTASFSCCFVEMISNSHVDLTLSNARQYYSSMGAISGKRGLKIPADNLTHQTDQWLSLCPSLSCTMQDAWLSLVWFWLKCSFLPMDALSHSLTRRNEEIHFVEKLKIIKTKYSIWIWVCITRLILEMEVMS